MLITVLQGYIFVQESVHKCHEKTAYFILILFLANPQL